MSTLFAWFYQASPLELWGLALAQNVLLVLLAVLVGESLVWVFRNRRVAQLPLPISWQEYALVASSILVNSAVAVLGVQLWKAGLIQVQFQSSWKALLDILVLVLALDLAMYLFHRLAHHPLLFRWLHSTHHLYDKPRPLTLFALNPLEALGFGLMLIAVCMVYPVTALGLSLYVLLNLLFGLVGHIGVEPLPARWLSIPLLRSISTSTFHAEHHREDGHNFGFYTLIWDKLFGTISPDYVPDFRQAGQASTATSQQHGDHP